MRRPAHAAGYSWRKWEDPLMASGSTRDFILRIAIVAGVTLDLLLIGLAAGLALR